MDRKTVSVVSAVIGLLVAAYLLNPVGAKPPASNSILSALSADDRAQPQVSLAGTHRELYRNGLEPTENSGPESNDGLRTNPFKSPAVSIAPSSHEIQQPGGIAEAPQLPELHRSNSQPKSAESITRLPPAPIEMPESYQSESSQAIEVPENDSLTAAPSIDGHEPIALNSNQSAGLGSPEFDFETEPTTNGEVSNQLALTVPQEMHSQPEFSILPEPGFEPNECEDHSPPSQFSQGNTAVAQSTTSAAPTRNSHRQGIRDFQQPLEADPGWVVENNHSTTSRESLLDIDIPRHVEARARAMLKDATQLADRGALCAAREQFLRILRITCQTLDTQIGKPVHARALANGLKALEEAEDFALTDNTPEADIHLRGFIQGHRTPILKDVDADRITALMAMQRYYKYAYEQLAIAGNDERVASDGLFALGRIESLMKDKEVAVNGGGPKSLALYHAALTVNARNGRAANELGVLLAKRGRPADALYVMQRAAENHPTSEVMNNLAVLHQQLADPVNARIAKQHASHLVQADRAKGIEGNVQWVSPKEFAALSDDQPLEPIAADTPIATAEKPAKTREVNREPIRTATKPNMGGTWDF